MVDGGTINLGAKDARGLIADRITFTVKLGLGFRWWMFRLQLAVQLCRLGAWVGGQKFVKEVEAQAHGR
jgi:hypothetical protein